MSGTDWWMHLLWVLGAGIVGFSLTAVCAGWLKLEHGVFLSVMPLLASRQAFADLGWSGGWVGTVGSALTGLLVSTYVTTAYHLGYPAFRGSAVIMPILGNDIMSLGMILTRNPLTAALSHAAMHVAAVLQGMETTIQLPPHY